MKFRPVILFPVAIALVVLIYAFGQTRIKSTTSGKPEMGVTENAPHQGVNLDASLKHVLAGASTRLTPQQADSVKSLSQQAEMLDGNAKADTYKKLASLWARTGSYITSGYYHGLAADAAPDDIDERRLAARMLAMGMNGAADSVARNFAVNQAVSNYEKLVAVDSANTQNKVELALVYVEGSGETMKGVLLLRDVEKTDPDNELMNLTLGRLAVVSNQFDKAITRLERLTRQHPDNAEAYIHLAEAYRATGQKDKALQALEQCKRVVKDSPEAVAQVEQIITSIKKS